MYCLSIALSPSQTLPHSFACNHSNVRIVLQYSTKLPYTHRAFNAESLLLLQVH